MPPPSILNSLARRGTLAFLAAGLAGLVCSSAPAAKADDPPSDAVGTIDGAAIAVSGPLRVEIVRGFVRTMLRSGSEVRVRSGTARLELQEGGFLSICGPAHFSVLKSGKMLTVALDTGSVHAYMEHGAALTIYTPQILVQTVAIGGGPQDTLVGFDEAGALCIRAHRGAVRVEQQLTGQSVIVPQSAGILIVAGQLDSLRDGGDRCSCDVQLTKYAPAPPVVATPETPGAEQAAALPRQPQAGDSHAPASRLDTPEQEQPIYQVFMPPLVYDAKAKVQPEFDPKMIVLVRRARVRPALIFQGRVEGEAAAVKETPPPKPGSASAAQGASAAPAPSPASKSAAPADSFTDRVRSFVRKLWSR